MADGRMMRKRCISKGLALPCTEKDDPDTKDKGREMLQKLNVAFR